MSATDAEVVWVLILVVLISVSVVSAVVFFCAVRDAAHLIRRWRDLQP